MKTINIRKCSDKEFKGVISKVHEEAVKRSSLGLKVINGRYNIGPDIPCGDYRIELVGNASRIILYIYSYQYGEKASAKPTGKKFPAHRERLFFNRDKRISGKVPLLRGDSILVDSNSDQAFLFFSRFVGLEVHERATDVSGLDDNALVKPKESEFVDNDSDQLLDLGFDIELDLSDDLELDLDSETLNFSIEDKDDLPF